MDMKNSNIKKKIMEVTRATHSLDIKELLLSRVVNGTLGLATVKTVSRRQSVTGYAQ